MKLDELDLERQNSKGSLKGQVHLPNEAPNVIQEVMIV